MHHFMNIPYFHSPRAFWRKQRKKQRTGKDLIDFPPAACYHKYTYEGVANTKSVQRVNIPAESVWRALICETHVYRVR